MTGDTTTTTRLTSQNDGKTADGTLLSGIFGANNNILQSIISISIVLRLKRAKTDNDVLNYEKLCLGTICPMVDLDVAI